MVTTEIDLDKELLKIPGVSVMETDLAEFILQEDEQRSVSLVRPS